MNKFDELMSGLYGWKVKDGEPQPPIYKFPIPVLERIHYFNFEPNWDAGMTFMGALTFILGNDGAKEDFELGGIGLWLPVSSEFRGWYENFGMSARQQLIALALMYGYDHKPMIENVVETDVPEWAIRKALDDYGYEKLASVPKEDHADLIWRASIINRIKN